MELSEIMPTLEDARTVHTQVMGAKRLIADKNKWCQNSLRSERREIDGTVNVRYCARGAIGVMCGLAVASEIAGTQADALMGEAARQMFSDVEVPTYAVGNDIYAVVNNAKEHDDVMMMFDRAIVLAEKRLGELLES